jgi:hypothetical protein
MPGLILFIFYTVMRYREKKDFGFVPQCGKYCRFESNIYIKLVGDVYSDEYLFQYGMRRGELDVQ